MSDEEEENSNSQEEEEDEQQNSEQQQDDDDEDDEDDDDDQDDEDQDHEDQDDEDQDDEDEEDEEDEGEEDDEEQSKQQSQQQKKKLPTFKIPEPQPFKFTSLLSQISSLSSSVDGLISTFHSYGGEQTSKYRTSYNQTNKQIYKPRLDVSEEVSQEKERSRVVIMKDEDTQVSMQPQIVIQPTRSIKEQTLSAKPYRVSNQSQKFLAQLYEQNKKLKRWQNSGHPMNTYMTTFSKNSGYGSSSNWNDKSRQKFQRKQYQKGLFNVDERNKQIDEAIQMLKRQQQQY